MARKTVESMPQTELTLRLRYAIDTAIKYPAQANIDKAIKMAADHPAALRSAHVKKNLGVRRWEWLSEYGVYPVGEHLEVAGVAAIKATITPELTK